MRNFLFCLILISELNSHAQLCFTTAVNYSVNPYPWGVCTADFNKDGVTDFACGSDATDGISVYLGQGNATFTGPQTYTTGFSERGIIAVDLNKDGNLDLAADNGAGGGTLSVLLGNGTGGFSSATTFTFNGSNSEDLVGGDFNEDGSPDIALTNHGGAEVTVLTGDGIGGFSKDTGFYVGGNSMSIVTMDFNHDGHLDLGLTTNNNNGTVAIMYGAGNGTFGVATHYGVGSMLGDNPWSLHISDFNGDSYSDLVCTNNSDSISVLMGTNIGTFGATKYFYSGYGPYRLVAGDMNGDNKADIAVGNLSNITLLAGDGNGNFMNSGTIASDSTQNITGADFNSDGKLDLLYIRYVAGAGASVALNCGSAPSCVASVTDSLFNISPLNWGVVPHYSSQVTNATWYWGDGTSSSGLYPSHSYAVAGWYTICVEVYTSCGDSAKACMTDSLYRAASSMVNISVTQTANGITSADFLNSPHVYPNPANSSVMIDGLKDNEAINVYSVIGDLIFAVRAKQNACRLDISGIAPGVYFVRTGDKTIRLVKE